MSRKRENLRWWIATLAMLAGVGVTFALGLWQLDRAAQKSAWHAAQQAQASASVLDAQALRTQLASTDAVAALQQRRISLQGQWLPAHAVYLDNRQMQGRPGFYVLMPLLLEQGDAVLVQRGWIARNFEQRQVLQPIETPTGTVQVEGVLAAAPARTYALADGDAPDAQQPQIRQNLNLPDFANSTGLALWPVTVLQTGAASQGLQRNWPQPSSGIATHHGYAFQWFAIAAVLLSMLVWFQWLQPSRQRRSSSASPSS